MHGHLRCTCALRVELDLSNSNQKLDPTQLSVKAFVTFDLSLLFVQLYLHYSVEMEMIANPNPYSDHVIVGGDAAVTSHAAADECLDGSDYNARSELKSCSLRFLDNGVTKKEKMYFLKFFQLPHHFWHCKFV
jgi:hypothetical protein